LDKRTANLNAFPLQCLNKTDQSLLLQDSLDKASILYHYFCCEGHENNTLTNLKSNVHTTFEESMKKKKFCSIDVGQTLQEKSLLDFLATL